MQVSYNPVFQVYNDLETLLHASTGEQINPKFLFIQFRLVS